MPPEKDNSAGISPQISRLSDQLSKDPNSKLFIPLAEEYMKAGMTEEAVMTLEHGLKAHPAYMSARVLLGKAHLASGELDKACEQFEMVVKAIPDNLLAHKKLGEIYKAQGRREDAAKSYRVVSILSPQDEEAARALAELESGAPLQEAAGEGGLQEAAAAQALSDLPEMEAPLEMPADEGLSPFGDDDDQAHEVPVFELDEPSAVPDEEEHAPPVYELDEPAAGPGYEIPASPEEAPPMEADSGQFDEDEDVVHMPVPEMETLEGMRGAAEGPEDAPGFEGPGPGPDAESLEYQVFGQPEQFGEAHEAVEPEEEPPAQVYNIMGPLGEEHEEKPAGYHLDIDSDTGLKDIFSLETDETPVQDEDINSDAKRPVYDLSVDVDSGEFKDFRIQPPKPVTDAGTRQPAPGPVAAQPAPAGAGHGKDPLKTETLAELYISQGFYDRAINIYKDLLVERPEDPSLRQKLEDLYSLAEAESKMAALKAGASAEEEEEAYEPVDFSALSEEEEASPFEAAPFEAEAESEAPPMEAVPFEVDAFEASPFEAEAESEAPPVEAVPFEVEAFEASPFEAEAVEPDFFEAEPMEAEPLDSEVFNAHPFDAGAIDEAVQFGAKPAGAGLGFLDEGGAAEPSESDREAIANLEKFLDNIKKRKR